MRAFIILIVIVFLSVTLALNSDSTVTVADHATAFPGGTAFATPGFCRCTLYLPLVEK